MKEATLVIMAAGMGSRYGGLKQIDAVDNYGHILMDYSIYDAIRAGFRRVVFIIKKEILEDFSAVIDSRISKWGIEVELAFQEQSSLMGNLTIPEGRKKPWGTAHAIACLGDIIDSPFTVINADDYYGRSAFRSIYAALIDHESESSDCYMVGYRLKNTLSENGGVSRGICHIERGYLKFIRETGGIVRRGGEIVSSGDALLDPDAVVSMNMWGLTPNIITECKRRFCLFLEENLAQDPLSCEYFLPDLISALIAEGRARVKVIPSDEDWYGVTYKEDKMSLASALKVLVDRGIYPCDF